MVKKKAFTFVNGVKISQVSLWSVVYYVNRPQAIDVHPKPKVCPIPISAARIQQWAIFLLAC